MIGNTELVEHGIQTERSTLRAHVGVNAGTVYVFKTETAKRLVDSCRNLPVVNAYTVVNGRRIVTARGVLVTPCQVNAVTIGSGNLQTIRDAGFRFDASTSDKGDRAVWVVQTLLKAGYFPLPIDSTFVTDAVMQRLSGDIIAVAGTHKIEVKCDYEGGAPKQMGRPVGERVTGNLFLQIAECNPLRQY